MQRKPSYYFRKSVTAALAAGAGLALGIQIEANQASAQRATAPAFATHSHTMDGFVPLVATPVLITSDPTHRVDASRECEAGIETDCIYN
jgi:hypothetical protein